MAGGVLLPAAGAIEELKIPHQPWYVCPEITHKPPYVIVIQQTSCYDLVNANVGVLVLS